MTDEQRLRAALHAASARPPASAKRVERLYRRRRHQRERRAVLASALSVVAVVVSAVALTGPDQDPPTSTGSNTGATPGRAPRTAAEAAPDRVVSRSPAPSKVVPVPPRRPSPANVPAARPSRTPAPRPTSPVSLVSEDFSSADAVARFAFRGGRWAVVAGQLRVSEPAPRDTPGSGNTAVHGARVGVRAVVQARLRIDDPGQSWGDVSLLFGYQDPDNYYFFSLNEHDDAATSGLFRVVDGRVGELATNTATVNVGQVYAVRVELTATRIRAYLDGRVVSEAAATVPPGQVGVGSRNDAVTADDLLVTG